ncbi:hypothetical protein [Desulfocurvibacter africanus]|uniref:hypothetical protein n=1 Tax=Desulfocurvibacter africanus TaxID=873 RepID=UPI00110C707F|nr:hypothetical protein [Desulfocurvibacter africanus]
MPSKPTRGMASLAGRGSLLAGLTLPTRAMTNSEFNPPPQTREQRCKRSRSRRCPNSETLPETLADKFILDVLRC